MHKIEKPQIQAVGIIALSGILYGFLGFFGAQLLNEKFSVSTMLFWRFLIAGFWMLGYSCWKQEIAFKNLSRLSLFSIPLFLSTICYSAGSAFYFLASRHTGTGLAMVIFFSYPLFVAIFAWAQNNWRINKYAMAALLAIVIGLFLLKGDDGNPITITGIVLGIISALFYAIYVFKTKQIVKEIVSSHFTMIICLNCAAIFLIISLTTQTFAFPTTLNAWVYIFAIGIVATAIPIQLLLEGLKVISPLKASMISVLEPVVTLLVGIMLLSEPISALQITGVFILLLGAIAIQFVRE